MAAILAMMTLQFLTKVYGKGQKSILHMVLHRMQGRQLHLGLQQEEQREGQEGTQKVLQALPKNHSAQAQGHQEGGGEITSSINAD
jgi:surface antigen